MTKSGTFLDMKLEYNRARDEIERLRAGCNPECPGCGLKPCNETGQAVLWCDECVGEQQAEIERLKTELHDVPWQEVAESQQAEIERLKQHKQDLNAAITLMRTLAKEQLDEAREAAKLIVARLHNNGDKDGAAKFERRYPWLEEDQ